MPPSLARRPPSSSSSDPSPPFKSLIGCSTTTRSKVNPNRRPRLPPASRPISSSSSRTLEGGDDTRDCSRHPRRLDRAQAWVLTEGTRRRRRFVLPMLPIVSAFVLFLLTISSPPPAIPLLLLVRSSTAPSARLEPSSPSPRPAPFSPWPPLQPSLVLQLPQPLPSFSLASPPAGRRPTRW